MLMHKQATGFTVIEVMVGIALFGAVMPSVILAVVGINRLNDRAADLTRANIVAERKMESIRSAGYNALTVDSTVDFSNELDSGFTGPKSANYTISEPTTGVRDITVTISYTDQGQTRNISYKSLISELGVAQ